MKALRGLTWRDPRGYDPLVACAALWRERGGVEIIWDQRPPRGFEFEPVAELARRYDLLIIDHAQIGQIVREACLLPLNRPERVPELIRLAGQSVGDAFNSYRWHGDQYALPVAAAAQVQAWRPDRLAAPVATWDDLLPLARAGRVLLPLRPPHALLLFYTLCANLGQPCGAVGQSALIDAAFGADVLARIAGMMPHLDPACYEMDPVAVLERLTQPNAREHCAPYLLGDVSYARPGFRAVTLRFADIPVAGERGPVGATLGGAGIAVSALCAAPAAAVAFAFWVASAEVQRGVYARAGGQPGNAAAWQDAAVNTAAGNFFNDTFETLSGAWVRPRHDGYQAFEDTAAERINAGLLAREPPSAVMADLNRMYAASFAAPPAA